ncbi:hypothetical protein Tco_0049136, partial [Tanacetum coccineum]
IVVVILIVVVVAIVGVVIVVAVIGVVVVVAIVGVVIVVAIIGVVVVVVVGGVSFILKLSFMVIGFLYRIVFHYMGVYKKIEMRGYELTVMDLYEIIDIV